MPRERGFYKSRFKFLYGGIFVLLAIFDGCSSGPRAHMRNLPSDAIHDAISQTVLSDDPLIEYDRSIPKNWWTLFDDEQLTAFIEQALVANPTLQSARANVLLAAYNADRLRSVLYPNFNLGGDVLRQKFSETGLIPFNNPASSSPGTPPLPATGGINGIPVYFTQYETEITLNYDLDIWGKNRKMWEAAVGQVRAYMAEENFTRLLLGISVAKVYFQLQMDYKREEIAQAEIENQTQYFNLIQRRLKSNVDNLISSQTAEVNLSSSKSSLLNIQGDIAVNEYQLKAYLAGDFQEKVFNIEIEKKCLPKVPLPRDIPLHLIAYRPDITAQLWLIQSAGKEIQAAKAGFYPDFSLTGLFGYQSLHLNKLFEWPSSYYNVDPAFTLPLFDGGRLIANLRSSEINYDLAILKYNDLILNAVQEVLTGLAVLKNTESQLQEYNNQLGIQQKIYTLTKLRQAHNLNSTIDVLMREQSMLQIYDKEIISLGNTIQAILSLIKALGGGYKVCEAES